MELLLSALLSKEERFLLYYQRRNLIDLPPSDENSASESDHGTNLARKLQTRFDSQKPMVRLMAISQTLHILKKFEGKFLNPLDEKLIRGFYVRSQIDKHLLRTKENAV